MPWILNSVNKPVFVQLGSAEMMSAKECYLTESEAKKAQIESCPHHTKLGHSGTGRVFCADCSKKFN